MILAVDVMYVDDPSDEGGCIAWVAGLMTDGIGNIVETHRFSMPNAVPYVPGEFYKRELPCVLELLQHLTVQPDVIIVDGYVDLAVDHPGLGRKLFEALSGRVKVIGVAKTPFKDAPHLEVLRGSSTRPLYVTAAGTSNKAAADLVLHMAGEHRIPTLLKSVDSLARGR